MKNFVILCRDDNFKTIRNTNQSFKYNNNPNNNKGNKNKKNNNNNIFNNNINNNNSNNSKIGRHTCSTLSSLVLLSLWVLGDKLSNLGELPVRPESPEVRRRLGRYPLRPLGGKNNNYLFVKTKNVKS